MVKYGGIELDRILFAISDPTRRTILDQLTKGERPLSEISLNVAMSTPALLKHLSILKGTGLVITRKEGRRVMCNLNPENLIRVATWLSKYRKAWEGQIKGLEQQIKRNMA
jgi:DNA-binding transcriptional ArsR family regulator